MQAYDIAILGGGIAGLSTAWWLGELGAGRSRHPLRIVLLEREPALATQSSARSAALLRTASDDPVLEEFALESAALLHRLGEEPGTPPLVDGRGIVLLGRGARAPAGGWEHRVALQAHARPIARAELARKAPHVVHAGEEAWLYPDEGCLDVGALIAALERGARARAIELRTSARVRAIERVGPDFVVEATGGEPLRAGRLVVAAGGWSAEIARLAGARLALRPTRRHLFVTLPQAAVDPASPAVWNERADFYSRPADGGLLACACDTLDARPEEHGVEPRIEASWRAKCAANLRGLSPLVLARAWSGTRTFARDERFVVGPDAEIAGLHWCAGLGGHGMTAGFAAGKLAAELLLGHAGDARFRTAFAPARLREHQRADPSGARGPDA